MSKIIMSFTPPEHLFLSSWYMESPLIIDNIIFHCVHQAFYASMTDDREVKLQISKLKTPEKIRELGATLIKPKHTEAWQIEKMFSLNKIKFENYSVLMKKLKDTGYGTKLENRLVYPDLLFGTYQNKGSDNLGKILMKIRDN